MLVWQHYGNIYLAYTVRFQVFLWEVLEKRAERLFEKARSLEPSLLSRVQEELFEIQLSGTENDSLLALNGYENGNENNSLNEKKLPSIVHAKEHKQQQQQQNLKLESRFEVMNAISDDDENDEFYDASSDLGETQQITGSNNSMIGYRPGAL